MYFFHTIHVENLAEKKAPVRKVIDFLMVDVPTSDVNRGGYQIRSYLDPVFFGTPNQIIDGTMVLPNTKNHSSLV